MEFEQIPEKCRLFQGIEPPERERLCRELGGKTARYPRGRSLWLSGDRVDSCGVVLEGLIRGESVSASGHRTVTAFHGPGEVFGDVLMSSPDSRSLVDIFAAEDSRVLFLSYESIMGGSPDSPAHHRLRENLLGEIAEKYWALRRRLYWLSAPTLGSRAARYLLEESLRQGEGEELVLGCSREDMAALLCANRSSLSRELSRMSRQGLIRCRRDRFRILDRRGLEKLAEG